MLPFLLPFIAGAKSFLSAALAFFSKPPGIYIGIAIAFILSLWWFGQHEFNRGEAAIAAANAKAAVKIETLQHQITVNVGMKFDAVKLADTQATAKRLDEVNTHVTPKADAACPVTLGFVRVFNGAAHGSVPDPAAGTDDSPSGVELSDVAKTTVSNDGLYDQVVDQLKLLQSWVSQQEAANPK